MEYEKYRYSLLSLIEKLHMAYNGSSDTMNDNAIFKARCEIIDRLDHWEVLFNSLEYDECIRKLCILVLQEGFKSSEKINEKL